MGLFFRKNHILRCWGFLSFLNWIGAVTLSFLLKLPPRKLEHQFVLWSFFLLKDLIIPINLPCSHAWNIVFMSILVLLEATKVDVLGLLVLHLMLLLNPWLIVEIHLKWLNWFHFLILEGSLLVILIDCMIFLSALQGCLCQQFLSLHS